MYYAEELCLRAPLQVREEQLGGLILLARAGAQPLWYWVCKNLNTLRQEFEICSVFGPFGHKDVATYLRFSKNGRKVGSTILIGVSRVPSLQPVVCKSQLSGSGIQGSPWRGAQG